MRPRWNKVFSDLIDNKLRTVLVVLSIAVGVLSVGVIAGAYVIISNDMSVSYASNNPANIEMHTDNFDDDLLESISWICINICKTGRRAQHVITNDLQQFLIGGISHLNHLESTCHILDCAPVIRGQTERIDVLVNIISNTVAIVVRPFQRRASI